MSDETELASPPADVTAPVPEVPIEPAETPEVSTETTPEPETADVTAQDETEPEAPKKNVPGSQKLKRRLQLIEADYEAANARAADLESRLAQFQQPQAEQGRPGIEREPKETDFPNDYFAYERAQTAWVSRQAVREEFARVQQQQTQSQTDRQRREAQIERQEAYEDSATTARERIDDFDKVIRSATDIKITNAELVDEIMASEKAALIHYYLAKNPEKARELNGLKGKELAREVGRLEARVHLPKPRTATGASPPPSQPKGGAATPYDPYTSTDMEAHVRWWKAQEKRGA